MDSVLRLTCALALAAFPSIALARTSLSATEIATRAELQLRGQSMIAQGRLDVNRDNQMRRTTFRLWTQGTKYAYLRVLSPVRDQMTTLRIGEDQWRHLKKTEQTSRIASSFLRSSWLGSDIVYEDIVRHTQLTSRYRLKLLGEETVKGIPCYKLEATPKDASQTERMHVWITRNELSLKQEILFDGDGQPAKRLFVQAYVQSGGYSIPSVMIVQNYPLSTKEFTLLTLTPEKVDVELPAGLFTPASLRNPQLLEGL